MITKILTGAAGIAALAAAAPASAQYYPGYSYPAYSYPNYSYPNYSYRVNPNVAASQCSAAVQGRLYDRNSLGAILGSLIGVSTGSGRVVAITSTSPTRSGTRVRGLATSGRYAYNNYGPYGVGAYGALGYGYNAADLQFRCDVDRRGYVRDVDIDRR
jgi:hypothetical protein